MKKAAALFLAVLMFFALCCSAAAETQTDEKTPDESDLSFSLLGLDGEFYTEELLSENELTMVNFWESWCGPCIREMPELEKLYQNYKEKGLNIVGVVSLCNVEYDELWDISGVDTDGAINEIIEATGVTYPIMVNIYSQLEEFETGSLPTTVFLDSTGNVVGEPKIGARSYEDWAKIVDELL